MIAYIPARGGSRRIPRKNVRLLGGKPALAHVVSTLEALTFLDATFVSTDDEGIASVAREAGARVLELRDPALADDHTPFNTLLRHDLPRHLEAAGARPEEAEILVVLPTACLVQEATYRSAREAFHGSASPVLFASVGYPASPFRALVREDPARVGGGDPPVHRQGEAWRPLFPDMLNRRSQDLPPAQVDAGLFYMLRWKEVRAHEGHWFTVPGGVDCFPVPASIAVDVDEPEDWLALERRFALRAAGQALDEEGVE